MADLWTRRAHTIGGRMAEGYDPPSASLAPEPDGLTLEQERIDAVLADLDHVRAQRATTHHDACWDEHIACLAERIRRTLTGEDTDHG